MSEYYGYSSHYAQAYYQSFQNAFPANHWQPPGQYQQQQQQQQQQWQQPQASSSYIPQGHSRCTYKNCTFTGPPKVLETHMMDRHLIYPAWWDKKKKRDEWDTDPSLKGKKITILGTSLSLDKPEDLAAWIEERKKRWPTSTRVEEKKRKIEEAIDRGQILPHDHGHRAKRPRTDESQRHQANRGGHRQQRGRGNGRGMNQRPNCGQTGDISTRNALPEAPAAPIAEPARNTRSDSEGESDNDEAPEVASSKNQPEVRPLWGESPIPEADEVSNSPKPAVRPPQKMPKKEAHNPFAARPVLLHRLLLPEIRSTISNLSQAVRFLVDNDFLEGFEESPGAAGDARIQVMNDKTHKGTE